MTKVETRGRKSKLYEYEGSQYTIEELIDISVSPCTIQTMRRRIRNHGIESAVTLTPKELHKMKGRLTDKEYQEAWEKGLKSIPEYDPDYELKQRISSYRKLGWTDEMILAKTRNV